MNKVFNVYLYDRAYHDCDIVRIHREDGKTAIDIMIREFELARQLVKIVGIERKIDCIKLFRVATGHGLLEAKIAIEAAALHPSVAANGQE